MVIREAQSQEPSSSAGVINGQSVKTWQSGGPCGYDAVTKAKGRRRHILTDTEGHFVHAKIHTADIKYHNGAPLVLAEIIRRFPSLRHAFTDGGYARAELKHAPHRLGKWTIEIVKRSDRANGPEMLPLGRRANAGIAGPKAGGLPGSLNRSSNREPHGPSSPRSSASPPRRKITKS
jgi:hypothetical protein